MRRKKNYKNCFGGDDDDDGEDDENQDEHDEIGSHKIETKSSFNL